MKRALGGIFLCVMALLVFNSWGWVGFGLFWLVVFVWRVFTVAGNQMYANAQRDQHPGSRW